MVRINKNGDIRISSDIKLSQEESDFISYIAEVTDESWQDVLDYILNLQQVMTLN